LRGGAEKKKIEGLSKENGRERVLLNAVGCLFGEFGVSLLFCVDERTLTEWMRERGKKTKRTGDPPSVKVLGDKENKKKGIRRVRQFEECEVSPRKKGERITAHWYEASKKKGHSGDPE